MRPVSRGIAPRPLQVPVDPDSVSMPVTQLISILASDFMVDPEATLIADADEIRALQIWCRNATQETGT